MKFKKALCINNSGLYTLHLHKEYDIDPKSLNSNSTIKLKSFSNRIYARDRFIFYNVYKVGDKVKFINAGHFKKTTIGDHPYLNLLTLNKVYIITEVDENDGCYKVSDYETGDETGGWWYNTFRFVKVEEELEEDWGNDQHTEELEDCTLEYKRDNDHNFKFKLKDKVYLNTKHSLLKHNTFYTIADCISNGEGHYYSLIGLACHKFPEKIFKKFNSEEWEVGKNIKYVDNNINKTHGGNCGLNKLQVGRTYQIEIDCKKSTDTYIQVKGSDHWYNIQRFEPVFEPSTKLPYPNPGIAKVSFEEGDEVMVIAGNHLHHSVEKVLKLDVGKIVVIGSMEYGHVPIKTEIGHHWWEKIENLKLINKKSKSHDKNKRKSFKVKGLSPTIKRGSGASGSRLQVKKYEARFGESHKHYN